MTAPESFRDLTGQLAQLAPPEKPTYILAELNDLLTAIRAEEVEQLEAPSITDPYLANYVAAMVDLAAHRRGVHPPDWTPTIEPFAEPRFAVPWMSLRAHLLTASPVPFRRRNIFIDSSLGDRV